MVEYPTWYAFKKDLEKETGRTVLNDDWFNVKPQTPLPWNRDNLRYAVEKLEQKGGLVTAILG